jgi:hypothetical protein
MSSGLKLENPGPVIANNPNGVVASVKVKIRFGQGFSDTIKICKEIEAKLEKTSERKT